MVVDTPLSELVVTLLAGLSASCLLASWSRSRGGDRAAAWSVAALLLYPYGYYLVGAPYSDALFLAAALGSFLLAERGRPVLGGLVGAIASATRPVGIGVVVGLVVLVRTRRSDGQARSGGAWVGLSALGMAGFMAFQWVRFGSPIAFMHAQEAWTLGRGTLASIAKADFFELLRNDPRPLIGVRLGVQALIGLAFLAAVPAVWRRYGAAYGCYTLIVVGLPIVGSAAFESTGRHMLAAFPVFALAGSALADQPRRVALGSALVSGSALLLVASFYARGYFMS